MAPKVLYKRTPMKPEYSKLGDALGVPWVLESVILRLSGREIFLNSLYKDWVRRIRGQGDNKRTLTFYGNKGTKRAAIRI